MRVALSLTAALSLACSVAAQAQSPGAPLIDRAIQSQGGAALEGVSGLTLHLSEVFYRVDDSERWQPPFWISVRDVREVRDVAGGRWRRTHDEYSPQFNLSGEAIDDGTIRTSVLIRRNVRNPGRTGVSDPSKLALAPERILLTAQAARDLRETGPTLIDGVAYDGLSFTLDGVRIDLFLDQQMHLPRRMELVRTDPYDLPQTAWGDVRWTTDWLFWRREPDGLWYPRQWSVARNGEPYLTDVVVSLDRESALDPQVFAVDPVLRAAFEASPPRPLSDVGPIDPQAGITTVADGVHVIPGQWEVTVVDQPDGLVIIESPLSSAYSARILKAIQARFPGRPIKALVTTTDALWHFAGLRTYVARGVPIYALAPTTPLLRRFIDAPHTIQPDELARSPRPADLREVSGPTVIGEGARRVVLYPIGGHGGERMMMAWLPDSRLLYASSNDIDPDLKAERPEPKGTFNLPEVVAAARREGLEPESYMAINSPLRPWSDVVEIARRAAIS